MVFVSNIVLTGKKVYWHFFPRPSVAVYQARLPHIIRFEKDEYVGKRCFIIGGAPSINEMDLTPLNDEYCIAVNRGFLLRDKGLKQVEFYGVSDAGGYKDFGRHIPNDFAKHYCIIGNIPWDRNDIKPSVFSMYSESSKEKWMSKGFMQFDITKPLAHSYTVVLNMLQIAVYAGFKEIYFIGIDNNFFLPNMHFYKDSEKEISAIRRWNVDPTTNNNDAFGRAHSILKEKNVRIFNAGYGGNLTSIPRASYIDLMNNRKV